MRVEWQGVPLSFRQAAGEIRTPDPLGRSQVLSSAELRRQRVGAHDRRDGNRIAFGPGESRSPSASSATLPPADREVQHDKCSSIGCQTATCEWCSWRLAQMRIAPPAEVAGGAIDSLLTRTDGAIRLRDAPLLRVACNDGALTFVPADLSSLTLDPQPARRDAPCLYEPRGRTRARPAQAGRAEISEWEIDSRFHHDSL